MLGDSIRRRRRAPVRGKGPGRDEGADRDERPPRGGEPDAGTVPEWLKWTGLALAVLVLSFGLGYVAAAHLLFPRPETAGAGVAVPPLYGLERAEAERTLAGLGLRLGAVTEVASLRAREGRVVAQEPLPEQQLRPGGQVSLAVSAGPPEARVPPMTGLGERSARHLLEAAGFEVDVRQVRSGGVAPGRVLRTEPAAGDVVRLPGPVALIVNVGPEVAEPADSPVSDPGPAEWP
jgi:eukaryotic-like serine/threonine-protein kinase